MLRFIGSENDNLKCKEFENQLQVLKESTRFNIGEIILESLFTLTNWTKLNDELFVILNNEFKNQLSLYQNFAEIEIIEDPFEFELYQTISGHTNHLISPKQLVIVVEKSKLQIQQLLQHKPNKEMYCDKLRNYLISLDEVMQLGKFDQFKMRTGEHRPREAYFNSVQNILRNERIHLILLSLFRNMDCSYKSKSFSSEFIDIYNMIMDFLNKFIYKNLLNNSEILAHFDLFVDMSTMMHHQR